MARDFLLYPQARCPRIGTARQTGTAGVPQIGIAQHLAVRHIRHPRISTAAPADRQGRHPAVYPAAAPGSAQGHRPGRKAAYTLNRSACCRVLRPGLTNIIITCTDNIRSRLDLWRFLKHHRKNTHNDEKTPIYWMDFGNAQTTGQVLIGNIRNKIHQPASTEYHTIPRMNVITEETSYSTIEEKDSGPSCSLAEALQKQDLFINSMLAQTGCDILWRMFREGRTFYRGAYLNLDTLRVNPIPV